MTGAQRDATGLVLVWFAFSTANLYSVARFEPVTVLTFCAVLVALVVVLRRSGDADSGQPPDAAVAAVLLITAVAAEGLRFFSYLPFPVRSMSVHVFAATSVACACAWVSGRASAKHAAVGLAFASTAVTAALAVRFDPVPRIDVWTSLQQAIEGLPSGRNPYTTVWVGSTGVEDAFTYLPMTVVLLAVPTLLSGDVRWALVIATVVAAAVLAVLARSTEEASGTAGDDGRGSSAVSLRERLRDRHTALPGDRRAAAVLLLLTPGQLVLIEQAWTEPLLFALLAGFVATLAASRPGIAVALLALALASKQHMVLMLPVLACWRPFGPRRAVLATVGAAAMCLPWLLAQPVAFVHDTVTLLMEYPPLRLSPNPYVWAFRHGHTPPFWVSGLVAAVAVTGTALAVRRTQPAPARLTLWLAVLFLAVNLANKQAFYNQFWLVGSLLLLGLAAGGLRLEQPAQPSREVVPAPLLLDPSTSSRTHPPG
ncbi:MAG: hypothetical protein M3Q27_01705 [Actinomycetota bacterium]|nr:hypothetical protein [Actinomycetota bacterium]